MLNIHSRPKLLCKKTRRKLCPGKKILSLIGRSEWRNYRMPSMQLFSGRRKLQLQPAVQSYRGLREREKNRELKWNMSLALPVLGIGVKRIIKELKVLKSRCILVRDVVFPAAFPQMKQAGRGRKTRQSSVTRSKGAEERHEGSRGMRKETKAGATKKERSREGTECISASPAERWKAQCARGHRYICQWECWKIVKKKWREGWL